MTTTTTSSSLLLLDYLNTKHQTPNNDNISNEHHKRRRRRTSHRTSQENNNNSVQNITKDPNACTHRWWCVLWCVRATCRRPTSARWAAERQVQRCRYTQRSLTLHALCLSEEESLLRNWKGKRNEERKGKFNGKRWENKEKICNI